jgi:2-phospho-L-lactate/phosphoenolpyruvate guanylyltransferase
MVWTLIPAKAFATAKQRLSPVLDDTQRAALAEALLRRTIAVAKAAFGEPVLVVTPDRPVGAVALDAGADRVLEVAAMGLNAELAQAARQVRDDAELLVLHADLPLLEPDDLRRLVASDGDVVIACDRHGLGTNALLLRTRARFFAFGEDSHAQHRGEAAARKLIARTVRAPGLSDDLDDPADWSRLGAAIRPFP